MATTIYKQYLDEARKKVPKLASNAVSNVTLPQGNPAGQGAANTSAANTGAVATNNGPAANAGAVATNYGPTALGDAVWAVKNDSGAVTTNYRPVGAAAPTSTQGGRTSDGKYRLGDGSTYDTLQDAINANAGSNDYVISEVDGETLYDGKPLYNGTGVLAAKGDGGKIRSYPGYGTSARDAAGNEIRPDYLGKDVETGGHTLHGLFSSSNGYIYDFDRATDEELMNHGYYRAPDGTVRIAEDQDYILNQLKNGLDPSQAASQMVQNQLRSGTLNVPGTGPVNVSPYYPQSGGKQSGQSGQSGQTQVPSGSWTDNPYYIKSPGTPGPTPSGSQPQTQPQKTPEQAYLDQYDYGKAPEWTGTDYETQRDEALKRAQSMRWDGSEYQDQRDQLLADAMKPYEGSPYDEKRDAALAAYGEAWQGSEYQPKRDAALERAENMRWDYDPNADPVWQALQKQYRREGDRATREAMGQAAAMTGGVPSSYAVTAASQAGDYYAAQLSDRLPQVYQDAYNRYLQEFQRQLGISDQYAGFDDREYSRWADQQGRNLDLADRYNQYGQQDYGMYQDRVNQQLAGADRYNGYDQNEYQRYLDQYGQQLDAADRLNNYGATEYGRYQDRLGQWNTDRNFQYNLNRDAVEDARYEDERDYNRAWNEDQRNYERWMDQLDLDYRERQFAQQLKEYADAQGWKSAEWQQYLREYEDQLSDKERQWVYQMARDAENDRRYEREFNYQMQQDALDNQYRQQQMNYQREQADKDRQYQQDVFNHNVEMDALDNQYRQQQMQYQQEQADLDRKYQQDVFNYNASQDALDNEYRNNQYQQMLEEYDTERYYDMMNAFRSMGFADPRIAQYLGIPEGTSWEDYGRQYGYEAPQSGGYSGGGYTGGGYTGGGSEPQTEPEPRTEPEPQTEDSNLYEFSNERHPNGRKKTVAYNRVLQDMVGRKTYGESKAEILAELEKLIRNHTITDYEGTAILAHLGYVDEPKLVHGIQDVGYVSLS